jgi:NAD(P)-dependent dehydrogenase (short-subunit alcohol dehydrogenase family)
MRHRLRAALEKACLQRLRRKAPDAVFLRSDATRYVTGQLLCINGGWTAR